MLPCLIVSTVTVQAFRVHVQYVRTYRVEEVAIVRDDQYGRLPCLEERREKEEKIKKGGRGRGEGEGRGMGRKRGGGKEELGKEKDIGPETLT